MSSRLGVRRAWSTCRAALKPCSKHTRPRQACRATASCHTAIPTPAVPASASPASRRAYSTADEPPGRWDGTLLSSLAPKRGRRESSQQLQGSGQLPETPFDPDGYESDYDPMSESMLESLYGPATAKPGMGAPAQEDVDSPDGDLTGVSERLFPDGGLTLEQEEALYESGRIPPSVTGDKVTDDLNAVMLGESPALRPQNVHSPSLAGHKFALPALPLPPGSHLKHRYHPVLHQFTNLLMRDGKLSAAQKIIADVLNCLRTAPPPTPSPKYPLLPGAPPTVHLPLNPVLYLTLAIDSCAPLIKIKRLKGMAGGGASLEIPVPLPVRTRRRTAFMWILDIVNKKPSMGSGRKQFASRLASEIIHVVEGSSSVWEKRELVHKQGTSARANLFLPQYAKARK